MKTISDANPELKWWFDDALATAENFFAKSRECEKFDDVIDQV